MEISLRLEGVTRTFGGITAVQDLSFAVPKGSITALIGPNGAGKTTTLNMMSRLLPVTSGRIQFEGRELLAQPPHRMPYLGINRTFQTPQIFGNMTVRENVMVGAASLGRAPLLSIALKLHSARTDEERIAQEADRCLAFTGIQDLAHQTAGSLPFGKVRLMEIARALASRPRLLLLDEPASGLSPAESEMLRELLFRLKAEGMTVLLVEHNMRLVMSTADYVVVMKRGQNLAQGTPAEVKGDKAVQEAYLGAAAEG